MSDEYQVSRKALFEYYLQEGKIGHYQKIAYSSKRAQLRMSLVKNFLLERVDENYMCLDVGCAEGLYTYWMSKPAKYVIGLDISLPKLQRGVRNSSKDKVSYILADWDYLPFRNCLFDTVLFSEGLEHTLDPEITLTEIFRVTKNRRYLILSTSSSPVDTAKNPFEKTYDGHLREFTSSFLLSLLHNKFDVTQAFFPSDFRREGVKSYARLLSVAKSWLSRIGVLNLIPFPLKAFLYAVMPFRFIIIVGVKKKPEDSLNS